MAARVLVGGCDTSVSSSVRLIVRALVYICVDVCIYIHISMLLQAELDHETGVCCVDISPDKTLLLAGTRDGQLYLWDLTFHYILIQQQREYISLQSCCNITYIQRYSKESCRLSKFAFLV